MGMEQEQPEDPEQQAVCVEGRDGEPVRPVVPAPQIFNSIPFFDIKSRIAAWMTCTATTGLPAVRV